MMAADRAHCPGSERGFDGGMEEVHISSIRKWPRDRKTFPPIPPLVLLLTRITYAFGFQDSLTGFRHTFGQAYPLPECMLFSPQYLTHITEATGSLMRDVHRPPLTFASVFAGIEGASVAWKDFGWRALWVSEIDPAACTILEHHYPDVPNLGDMTRLAERVRAREVPAPDILVGGSPCQAYSHAGARRGLSDPRGALTLAYVRLIDALDAVRIADGKSPIVVLWENVPGVLTSHDNAFGHFLGGLAGEDGALEPAGRKWTNAGCVFGPQRTIAWRVLDAQYFGVAQRRRRVFAVASARDGADPTAILFESEGVRRDTAPGRETGQDVTGTLSARTQGGGGLGTDFECAGGLTVYAPEMAPSLTASGRGVARARESRGQDPVIAYGGNRTSGPIDCATACNAHGGTGRLDFESETFVVCGPVASPVTTRSHNGDAKADAPLLVVHGSQDPCVSEHVAFALGRNHGQENAVAYGEVAHTLRGEGFDASEDGTGRGTPLVPCHVTLHDVAHTLRSNPYNNSDPVAESSMHVLSYGAVRRLTPRECEKLQGLPLDYTLVPDPQCGKTKRDRKTKHDPEMQDYWRRGGVDPALLDRKLLADGPRYKAIGNGFAVPVVRWIGARIHKVLTAATLRDEDAA